MSEQITVIAKFRAKPEMIEKLVEVVFELVRETRREAGCVNYDFHQDLEDETIFFMHETWMDESALEEHFKTPHVKKAFAVVPEIMAEPIEIRRLRKIEVAA